MTRVKIYDLATGHVETVKMIDFPDSAWEMTMAKAMVSFLSHQDHGTDTVYYASRDA